MKKRTVWLHDDQVARILTVYGPNGFSLFVRKAIEAQLEILEEDWRRAEAELRNPPAIADHQTNE